MIKKHGVNVPIFSLRTKLSGGIGEYPDLIPLIDWLKAQGFSMLQLLPINDSGLDPSPYNALSAFALNPLYLRLEGFSEPRLNSLERIPYSAIHELKERYFREKILPHFKADLEYEQFVETHTWLSTYAKFKALKTRYHDLNWTDWPSNVVTEEELRPFYVEQFLCYQQMGAVKKYAEENGIEILGDIPILVSPDSADVWANPHLFNLDLKAGAPPDGYNPHGQWWGFPPYRWDEHEKTDFEWWKARLRNASEVFHSYRIDHIVGFFRIWAMRDGQSPVEGLYYPLDTHEWLPQGEKLLRMMLNATLMRPIGEDLGTVPDEVRTCMSYLAVPGTKVIRWERNISGHYIPYDKYPEVSLTTVSTHDSEPLRLWWQRCPGEVEEFCRFKHWIKTEHISQPMLKTILYDSHHTHSRFAINLLLEYLSLFPELSYSNIEQDRINVPGTVTPDNWTYRMKPYIEDMVTNTQLNEAIHEILAP